MATAKKEVKEKKVEVFIHRGTANEDPNMLVSINGVNYLLPRGKKSLVPPAVAWEIERAQRARENLDKTIDAMLGQNK